MGESNPTDTHVKKYVAISRVTRVRFSAGPPMQVRRLHLLNFRRWRCLLMVKEKLKGYSVCVCDYCGQEFKRRTAEVNRSIRLGMGQFHKGSCATKWLNAHPTERMKEASRNNLKKHSAVRK